MRSALRASLLRTSAGRVVLAAVAQRVVVVEHVAIRCVGTPLRSIHRAVACCAPAKPLPGCRLVVESRSTLFLPLDFAALGPAAGCMRAAPAARLDEPEDPSHRELI